MDPPYALRTRTRSDSVAVRPKKKQKSKHNSLMLSLDDIKITTWGEKSSELDLMELLHKTISKKKSDFSLHLNKTAIGEYYSFEIIYNGVNAMTEEQSVSHRLGQHFVSTLKWYFGIIFSKFNKIHWCEQKEEISYNLGGETRDTPFSLQEQKHEVAQQQIIKKWRGLEENQTLLVLLTRYTDENRSSPKFIAVQVGNECMVVHNTKCFFEIRTFCYDIVTRRAPLKRFKEPDPTPDQILEFLKKIAGTFT